MFTPSLDPGEHILLTIVFSTEYVEGDYAIVQSPDFATLFILTREQNVTTTKVEVSLRSPPGSPDQCMSSISMLMYTLHV